MYVNTLKHLNGLNIVRDTYSHYKNLFEARKHSACRVSMHYLSEEYIQDLERSRDRHLRPAPSLGLASVSEPRMRPWAELVPTPVTSTRP